MPAPFELHLDSDQIQLFRTTGDGSVEIGSLRTTDPRLSFELKALVIGLGEGDIEAELILPASQILYYTTSVTATGDLEREDEIRLSLEGRTPYAIDEIAFDWDDNGVEITVAAVAHETLVEAEAFARAHGIIAQSFSARPDVETFARPPVFSPSVATDDPVEDSAEEETSDPVTDDGSPQAMATFASVRRQDEPPKEDDVEGARVDGDTVDAKDAEQEEPASSSDDTAEEDTSPKVTTGDDFTAEGVPSAGAAADTLVPKELVAALGNPVQNDPESDTPKGAVITGATPHRLKIAAGISVLAIAGVVSLLATFGREEGPVIVGLDAQPEISDTSAPPSLASPTRVESEPDDRPLAEFAGDTFAPTVDELTEDADFVPSLPGNPTAAPNAPLSTAPDPAPVPSALTGAPQTDFAFAPEPPVNLLTPSDPGIALAAIDPVTTRSDAFAMPRAPETDSSPLALSGIMAPPLGLPPEAETDAVPSPENRADASLTSPVAPGGVEIALGTAPTADLIVTQPDGATNTASGPEVSSTFRPRQRPQGLAENNERARFGGRTLAELSGLRPRARPQSDQAAAAADPTPTTLAIATSVAPRTRPDTLDQIVAAVRRSQSEAQAQAVAAASTAGVATSAPQSQAASAPTTSQTSIPTRAEVAREATIVDAIRMNRMNLIGVYGADSDRRALIRMPSGRLVKVQVGDRIDGGNVAVIGDNSLRYTKGGQNITLTVPSG